MSCGMGSSRINSSLGSQWIYRIDYVDDQIKKVSEKMTVSEQRLTYLNVKLNYKEK